MATEVPTVASGRGRRIAARVRAAAVLRFFMNFTLCARFWWIVSL